MKKKKLELPVLWMEQTEGTDEWYVGMHYGGLMRSMRQKI